MNDFEPQVPIIRDGWDCLALPRNGQLASIPDNVMLDELIRAPQPYRILPLLLNYKTSGERLKNVWRVIHDKQKQPSWKLINKALKGTNSKRLYIVSSQNMYRISPSLDSSSQEANLESQRVLQFASNRVVNYLSLKLNCLSETDLLVKEIFNKTGHCFETYQFHEMVQRYCNFILPYPYKTRFNREKYAHTHLIKLDDEIEIENRLKERFSLYRYSCEVEERYIHEINLDGETSRDFNALLDNEIEDKSSKGRRIAREQRTARSQRLEELLLSPRLELHQCVFCYRFSFVELPPQGDDFKQHCDRKECEKAYDRWLRHVNRLEIRLKRKEIID